MSSTHSCTPATSPAARGADRHAGAHPHAPAKRRRPAPDSKDLPVPVPVPVAVGEPGGSYPWRWTVVPWLDGRNPEAGQDLVALATDLAGFVRAMIAIDPMDGPIKEGIQRGVPLAWRDELTRRSIAALGNRIDGRAVSAAWDEAMAAGERSGPPVWLHGDLLAGNLLVERGRLTGVIDFGSLGRGDPAVELRRAGGHRTHFSAGT